MSFRFSREYIKKINNPVITASKADLAPSKTTLEQKENSKRIKVMKIRVFFIFKKLEKEYRHDNTVINSDRARVKLPVKPLFVENKISDRNTNK